MLNSTFKFSNTSYKKLYCGENCFSNALLEIITEQRFKNIFFISTNSLANTIHYQQIKENIRSYLIGEFPNSRPHTPLTVVNQAVQLIKKTAIPDVIVAFGGGSVMDLAKAIAHELDSKNPSAIISLPTTLSGAEFNSNIGVTDQGVKHVIINPLTAARWIILDPILSQYTPSFLWANTGCKAFSDCIEAVCSKNANKFTNQLAFSAIQLLNKYLLPSFKDANNYEAKQNCLIAPAFSMPAAINTSSGLIIACRLQLGARFNIPHGIASAIMMPHILKWNFDYAINQFSELARVLSLASETDKPEIMARKFLHHVGELVIQLNLNKKLSEFVKDKKLLQEVVKPIMASPFIHANVRPVTDERDILYLLEAAW